jgi:anti-anti-sigma factor
MAVAALPPNFFVRVLAVSSDAARIVVGGEIDLATGPALRDALAEQMGHGQAVVLDLSGVTFIDSSGLAVLIEAVTAAKVDGWSLGVVSNLPPAVRRLLELTGLEAVLPLVED